MKPPRDMESFQFRKWLELIGSRTDRLGSNAVNGWTGASNLSTDRTYDADSTTVAELADVLGTLIEDLKTAGVLSE
jgi:methionine synthase II (cobalamin-independent)